MDARDARLLLDAARDWSRRGLLAPGALDTLEADLAPDAAAADADAPSIGLAILYALAGVLLGAACIAVPVLLKLNDRVAPWWMLSLGLAVLALGLLLWRRGAPTGIVDALLVGALVPLSFMGLPDQSLGRWLSPLSLLAAILVVALPRPSSTVPVLASVAVFASAGVVSHRLAGNWFDSEASAWLWLGLALAQMAATLGLAGRRPWRTPVLALLCIGAVIPFVLALDHALPSQHPRTYELLVGGFELGLLLVGLALRQRGLVLGAAIVVAIDAIAYAFETNVFLGILVLLGVAVALVVLASTLKRGRRLPPPA